MVISLVMLALEAGLAAALDPDHAATKACRQAFQATGPAIALCVALAFASITKSRLLQAQAWRAGRPAGAGTSRGRRRRASSSAWRSAIFLPESWQLVVGVPAILVAFGAVLWTKGFGPEDRELFRLRKDEVEELREAEARGRGARPDRGRSSSR